MDHVALQKDKVMTLLLLSFEVKLSIAGTNTGQGHHRKTEVKVELSL